MGNLDVSARALIDIEHTLERIEKVLEKIASSPKRRAVNEWKEWKVFPVRDSPPSFPAKYAGAPVLYGCIICDYITDTPTPYCPKCGDPKKIWTAKFKTITEEETQNEGKD